MDIKTYLADYSNTFDIFTSKYFQNELRKTRRVGKDQEILLKYIFKYASLGKKFRGALTMFGYNATPGIKNPKIISVSVAIELIHSFLLIHDDVIDRDKLRRGMSTVHEKFGLERAIMAGDIACFLAYELILNSGFKSFDIINALKILHKHLLLTSYGEDMDIIGATSLKKAKTVDILKSANYTFVLPLAVGATLGKAKKSTLDAIEGYGLNVGLAFQMRDDYLGLYGDSKITGKSNTGDIEQGKKTPLYFKALKLASNTDKTYLLKNYGTKSKSNITKIKKIIAASGAAEASMNDAKDLIIKGKTYIDQITTKTNYKKLLSDMADYMVTRQK